VTKRFLIHLERQRISVSVNRARCLPIYVRATIRTRFKTGQTNLNSAGALEAHMDTQEWEPKKSRMPLAPLESNDPSRYGTLRNQDIRNKWNLYP